jgi:hypothetical protein
MSVVKPINSTLTFQQLETLCNASDTPQPILACLGGGLAPHPPPYRCKHHLFLWWSTGRDSVVQNCDGRPGEGCECLGQ